MEFENAVQQYSWVQVHGEGVKAVLVEDSIVWAPQSDGPGSAAASANSSVWPALVSTHLQTPAGIVCRRENVYLETEHVVVRGASMAGYLPCFIDSDPALVVLSYRL